MKKIIIKLLTIVCVLTGLLIFAHEKPVSAASVKLNKKSATIELDGRIKLKVKNTTAKIKWKSSNPAIARVSKKGNVYALSVGECTITAKVGKTTLTCNITVTDPVADILDSTDTIYSTTIPISSKWLFLSEDSEEDTHNYIVSDNPYKTFAVLVIPSDEDVCSDINTSEETCNKYFQKVISSFKKSFKSFITDVEYEIIQTDSGFLGKMTAPGKMLGVDGVEGIYTEYMIATDKDIITIMVFEEGNATALMEKTVRRILLQAECA